MRVGTIAEIWRYPVKSMGGESIDASPIGDLGIFGDRAYALRDDEAGEIRGAKKIPGLLHFASRYLGAPTDGYNAAPVEITTPDGALIGSGDDDASSLLSAAVGDGEVPLDRPISPIGLVRIAGPVEVGLQLLAFVNVFVGVLNFVPLYPLDGGHFAVALYEKVRGRPADIRKLMPVAVAVFIFIVILGLLGIYFDIVDPIQFPE